MVPATFVETWEVVQAGSSVSRVGEGESASAPKGGKMSVAWFINYLDMKRILFSVILFVFVIPSKGHAQNIPSNGYYAGGTFYSWQGDSTSANIIVANMEHYNAIVSNLQTLFNSSGDEVIYDDEDDNIIVNSNSLRTISKATLIQQISVSSGDIAFVTYAKSLGGEKIWLRNEIYVQFVDTSYFRIYALPLLTTYDVATYNYEGDNEFHLVCNDEEKMVLLANLLYQHFSTEYSTVDFYSDASLCSNNDTYFSDQWGLHNTGQHNVTPLVDIKAVEAWDYIHNHVNQVSKSIKVAVVDDGIEPHEDLYYENGVSKLLSGYTANGDGSGGPLQGHFHGQCCAGIIGAVHNDIGIAGVAPYSQIISFRICKKNLNVLTNSFFMFSASKIANSINKAWNEYSVDVINCSWHHTANDKITQAIQNACTKGRGGKGCILIGSSGNSDYGISPINYPACLSTVIAVGAIDTGGIRADFSNHGNRLDLMAPGVSISTIDRSDFLGYNPFYSYGIGNDYNNLKYTAYFNGTSAAAAFISGVAALILSVNPNLTSSQVRNIINSTAQKVGGYSYLSNQNHPSGTWNDDMGYGLVNAYAAVKKALPDLYIRDDASDNGNEPSTANPAHNSPDIWTTDLNGNVCNPTGDADCYVCVRVRNRSSFASLGNEKLIVNWAKAGVSLYWKGSWTGSLYFWNSMPRGGYVTSTDGITIPSIPAGRDTVLCILWHTPDPEDYSDCIEFSNSSEVWHFCLAARVHDGTPIVGENDNDLLMRVFTRNNNNVAWKNISIISGGYFSAIVNACNLSNISKNFTINLTEVTNANTPSITDNAEVYITLDAGLLAAINGNANISGLDWVNSNTLRWVGGNACIPVTLSANSDYAFMTTVHFIADQIPATNNFNFDIEMRNPTGDTVLGGEHYQCIRTNGRWFEATFTCNTNVLLGDPVTLVADDINEDADYQWYDEQGNSIGNGLTCIVYPQQTTSYTLRVTADADGYRAYRTVSVLVTDGELRQLSPNPADNQVRIGYALSRNVSAATLQILNGSGQVVHSQALSGGNNSKVTGEAVVNTSSLAASSYTVRLISSNGKVHDSKTLVVR